MNHKAESPAEPKRDFQIFMLTFILVYFSSDTFMFGTNSNTFFTSIPRYITIMLLLYLLVFYKSSGNWLSVFAYILALIFLFSISCFINEETFMRYLSILIYILFAFVFATRFSAAEFLKALDKFLYIICIMAIIIEIVAYVSPSLIRLFPIVKVYAGSGIYNMFLGGIHQEILMKPVIRTNGIFWEPGVFQIYINLCLMYQLFLCKKPDFRRVMIYIIAVLITFSTAGYIVLLWVLLIYALFTYTNKDSKPTNVVFKVLIISLLVFGLAFTIIFDSTFLYDNVFYKFQNTSSRTTAARIGSIFIPLDIAKDYPWFGIGASKMPDETLARSIYIIGVNSQYNTNTFLFQFAAYGIPFGILFTLGTYFFTRSLSESKWVRLLLFGAIIMMYFNERLQSPLPFIIMTYGFINLSAARKKTA